MAISSGEKVVCNNVVSAAHAPLEALVHAARIPTRCKLPLNLTIPDSTEVSFFSSSENVDTDFVVDLHDIYPDGDVQYLQRGFLRASLRRVDAAESTPDHLWRPYDKPEPLTPGKIYQVRLTLPPLGAVLRKGHRLQVELLAPSVVGQPDWGAVADQPAGAQHGLRFSEVSIPDPCAGHPRRQGPGARACLRIVDVPAVSQGWRVGLDPTFDPGPLSSMGMHVKAHIPNDGSGAPPASGRLINPLSRQCLQHIDDERHARLTRGVAWKMARKGIEKLGRAKERRNLMAAS